MPVLIIGGGISAITAARELTNKGVTVRIIEAQDRLGGRLKTIRPSPTRCYDLGASWMHETLTNPLFRVAVKEKIHMEYDDGLTKFYTSKGPLSPRLKTSAVAEDIMSQMRIDYMLGKFRKPDMSIRDFSVEFVNEWPLISEENKQLAPRYIQFLEHWSGQSWLEGPASGALLDFLGRNAFVLGGYDRIFKWVYDQVDLSKARIDTNTPVRSVAKQGDKFIVSTDTERIESEYVICTIPLGTLQASHESLFSHDTIPETLRKTISNGKIGKLGKIVMEFPERFWDYETDQFQVIVDQDPMKDAQMEPGNFFLSFTNVYKDEGDPPALIGLVAPPLTEYLEAHPQEAFRFLKPGLEVIRKDTNKEVPKPLNVWVTDWTQNPYFQGSYSAFGIGEDYESTVQPFVDGAGNLRFAGEHTVYDGNGCVHGAYASGIREAGNILDALEEHDSAI